MTTPNISHLELLRENVRFAYHAVAASVILCACALLIGVQLGFIGILLQWFDF